MICERCKKNEATVYYKETVNGKTRSYSLCAECAAEAEKNGEIEKMDLGGFFDAPFVPFGGVESIFGSLFGIPSHQSAAAVTAAKKCGLCGCTFSDLVKEGKVGCPKCYETFADELEPTIHEIHGSTSHTGDAPERYKQGRELKKKINELEKELKDSIHDENYERAAEIRDELKGLRGKDGE